MAYATAYSTATTQAFLNKVEMAIVSAAIAIANEGAGVANHAARAALASKILQNPQGYAQLFAVGVAADGVTDNSSIDTALDTRVSGIFNSYI